MAYGLQDNKPIPKKKKKKKKKRGSVGTIVLD
jgi:hypothetical protein